MSFTYQDTAVAKGTGKSEALATHALTMNLQMSISCEFMPARVGDAAAESRWKGRDRCNLRAVKTWQAISFAHAQDGTAIASGKVPVAAYVCCLNSVGAGSGQDGLKR